MTGLITDSAFEKDSHHDEKKTGDGDSNDPRETVLTVTRNEGEGRCEEDDEPDRNMYPCRMGIGIDRRKEEREERHNHAVNDTSGGKGDSETIPNFFHSGHIAEPQQSVYNGGKFKHTEIRR